MILGLLGYYLSSFLDFLGLQYISAGLERLILFLAPSFVLLLSVFLMKRRITLIEWSAHGISCLDKVLVHDVQLSSGTYRHFAVLFVSIIKEPDPWR